MKLQDIKDLIDSGGLQVSSPNYIESGALTSGQGAEVEYKIHHGWDIALAHQCNKEWGAWNFSLLSEIDQLVTDDDERQSILESIDCEDGHWDWVNKSIAFTDDSYEWFFLVANSNIQGICVIYHPKDCITGGRDIFYIEYVSVAPWNRSNLFKERTFGGIGSYLVRCAQRYAVDQLGLSCGFSLHSLPQATGYYGKIGMQHYPERDKGTLSYFEMSEEASKQMLQIK